VLAIRQRLYSQQLQNVIPAQAGIRFCMRRVCASKSGSRLRGKSLLAVPGTTVMV
jgi:hypothetical protein